MTVSFLKAPRSVREWWECRTKRCDYYNDYLAYGPAELTHEGYHAAMRKAEAHFKRCTYNGPNLCPMCSRWERAIRA